MFKCQVLNRLSKPYEKEHRIVIETRQKEYKERRKNEETRMWEDLVVGHGFETVKEIVASEEGVLLWNSWGPEQQRLFVLDAGL